MSIRQCRDFPDGRADKFHVNGEIGCVQARLCGRRSPTIINAAFGQIFMWDGRAASLEEQALGPIKADVEMNLPIDKLMERLKAISGYAPMFEAAFPNEGMQPDTVAKAIATYER